ncbi:hypothetical protein [Aliarcobacter lanthieri]|uniref:hypothetical protein n=1 Tax=Aliarcobacter lanthieri TaxID=1355374 RepID=UPI00047E60E1|nr:hypothetical protein [Aliarcobacter lanthieri]QKF59258.1 hypothetical protein ALANTH_1149 [Aliarcobacter lanthieri]
MNINILKIKGFVKKSGIIDFVGFMLIFLICIIMFSAYSDMDKLKEDCGNPFSRDCIENIIWYSFQATPFGYVIDSKNYK